MITLSPLPNDTPSLTACQVHTPTRDVLLGVFSDVEINGYQYTQNALWDVLKASVNRVSTKSACESYFVI